MNCSLHILLLLLLRLSSLSASSVPSRPSLPVTTAEESPATEGITEAPVTSPLPFLLTTTDPTTTLSSVSESSWTDLVISVARLVAPYLSYVLPDLSLDWEGAIGSVRSAMTNMGAGDSPVKAAAVGIATLASPVLLQVARSLLGSVVHLVDNSLFVATGHGLARRAIDEDLLDDLMDVLVSSFQGMTRHLGHPP